MDDVKEVKLKRSDSIGFGFKIFGGKGSGFPPVVYQVVDQSRAVSGTVSLFKKYIFSTQMFRVTPNNSHFVHYCLQRRLSAWFCYCHVQRINHGSRNLKV